MSSDTPDPDETPAADDALARHREALKKRFPLPPPRKARPGSASLALALALLGTLIWYDPAYRSERYSSMPGQVQEISLSDGSRITLDGASQIEISWHLRSRRSTLLAGQALFDVTPTTYRPFLTEAGPASIRVLGTRYNVSRQASSARITVEQGRVAVYSSTDELLLTPGQQVLVDHDQLGKPLATDARALTSWVNGRLVFDRTPLAEVLDTLRRQQPDVIYLRDPELAELPVSGTFDSANPDMLLSLLPKILPLQMHKTADGTLVVSRRSLQK